IQLPTVVHEAESGRKWTGTAGTRDYLGLLGPHAAILLKRALRCRIYEGRAYDFTKGIEYQVCAYCWVGGGHIYDNRYNRVWSTAGSDDDISFSNSNKVYGGRLGHTSA